MRLRRHAGYVGRVPISDGGLMSKIIVVPSTHIDRAWKEGACRLADACATSGGEITGDQLKMMLSRGERILVRMDEGAEIVGWAVLGIEQLPNMRALYVYELWAPGGHFERFVDETKALAEAHGCSALRCAAKPAQARLYKRLAGFAPVYETLEVQL